MYGSLYKRKLKLQLSRTFLCIFKYYSACFIKILLENIILPTLILLIRAFYIDTNSFNVFLKYILCVDFLAKKSMDFGESRITEADDDSSGSGSSLSETGEYLQNCGK